MEMQEAFVTCVKKYAVFSGRATRSEYWWFTLCQVLIVIGMSIVSENLGGLAMLVLLMPALSVSARRLHDLGRSGWWLLIGFIPLVGNLVLLFWAVQPSQAGENPYGSPGI
jgi:uncharacterized membrane protein YhaH (DUF805 family)